MFTSPINGQSVPAFPVRRFMAPLASSTTANVVSSNFSEDTSVILISTTTAITLEIGKFSAMTTAQRNAFTTKFRIEAGTVLPL